MLSGASVRSWFSITNGNDQDGINWVWETVLDAFSNGMAYFINGQHSCLEVITIGRRSTKNS